MARGALADTQLHYLSHTILKQYESLEEALVKAPICNWVLLPQWTFTERILLVI